MMKFKCESYFLIRKILGQKNFVHPSICSLPKRFCSTGDGEGAVVKAKSSGQAQVEQLRKASQQKGLPQRPPFLRNFFTGNFDLELFTYPEAFYKDEYDKFHTMLPPIERFYKEKVDRPKIDKDGKISPEVIQGLKDFGLFGMQVPSEYGGLGMSETECCKIGEILGLDTSIMLTLLAHQSLGYKGILLEGTPNQKATYLPSLASGDKVAALCISESANGSDMSMIESTAIETRDKENYILNGTKTWITNGGIADVYTVLAKTKSYKGDDLVSDGMTVFIVERGFGGISTKKAYQDRMAVNGCNIEEVSFVDTAIPKENILGKIGEGSNIALKIQNAQRHLFAASAVGLLKHLLNYTIMHTLNRVQFKQRLSSFAAIRRKIGRMAIDVYGLESMVYLTAGLIDKYTDQDCSLESAATKVFSSTKAIENISSCLEILGSFGHTSDLPFERSLRDIRIASSYDGPVEMLKLIIGLSGIQLTGNLKHKEIDKLRKPFLNPLFVFKKAMSTSDSTKAKLEWRFFESLHLSLNKHADKCERLFIEFKTCVEFVLIGLGSEIGHPKYQMVLLRLADIAIDLYAMTAVLSRASRSYCKGLYNSEYELTLAGFFISEASARIEKHIRELKLYPAKSEDITLTYIAEFLSDEGKYAVESPTTKFFW